VRDRRFHSWAEPAHHGAGGGRDYPSAGPGDPRVSHGGRTGRGAAARPGPGRDIRPFTSGLRRNVVNSDPHGTGGHREPWTRVTAGHRGRPTRTWHQLAGNLRTSPNARWVWLDRKPCSASTRSPAGEAKLVVDALGLKPRGDPDTGPRWPVRRWRTRPWPQIRRSTASTRRCRCTGKRLKELIHEQFGRRHHEAPSTSASICSVRSSTARPGSSSPSTASSCPTTGPAGA